MNPFDSAKMMGDLWGPGVESFVETQRRLFEAVMPASTRDDAGQAAKPDLQSFQAAQAAFQQAWSHAQSVASGFADIRGGGEGKTPDPIAARIMDKIFDPRGWLSPTNDVDEALKRMAEGPRLADLWGAEREFGAIMAAWLALRRQEVEHDTLMLDAWSRAAALFAKAVDEHAESGKPLESAQAMMALWVEIANDSLLETQRGDAFLKSQSDTLKASTDLRLSQQKIGEFYGRIFGLPTRAELDDVHKSVTELRRELRALKRSSRAAIDPRPGRSPGPPHAEDLRPYDSGADPSPEGRAESTRSVEPGWGTPGLGVAPPRSAGADSPSPAGRDRAGASCKGLQDEDRGKGKAKPRKRAASGTPRKARVRTP